jgi:ABC-2 type transport system permease protein
MSTLSDAAAAPAAARKVRPFYWSVRRELWENRAIYLAPLAVAGVVLAGFLFHLRGLSRDVLAAGGPQLAKDAARTAFALQIPYIAAAGAVFVTALGVAVFYCLGALHGERRDRTVLFWKSLPVSDGATVLAKVSVPLLVLPVVVFTVVVATQLVILALSAAVLLAAGVSPGLLWAHLQLPLIWAMLPYGLAVNALWYAPIVGWLLLVSAWARRMTFVWAVAPPLALSLFELLAFHTHYVWSLVNERLMGGLALAFSVGGQGKAPIQSLSQVDPSLVLANPGLWGGLAFGAACLAACVWLRRTRDPI